MKYFTACIAALLLTACAGTPFRWDQARQIKAGMTPEQVTALVGTPNRVDAQGDVLRYIWVHANGLTGNSRSLRVDFRDGRAIQAPPIPASFED